MYLLVAISVSSLVISYGLTKFIIHQLNSKSAQPHINRGGDTNPKEIIAANAIIACVADNTMLKNPSLINVIFSNLKENIRDTSLTTAPTLIRVIADSILKLKRTQSQPMDL